MKSLKGSAEEKQLLQRYVKQLDDQENRLEVLRRDNQKLDRRSAESTGRAEPADRGARELTPHRIAAAS